MSTSDSFDEGRWRTELLGYRDQKDQFFTSDRQSPIPSDQRREFDGLSYFDPEVNFRVAATVNSADEDDIIVLETTADTEIEYERVASLHFTVSRKEYTLVSYRQVEEPTDDQPGADTDGHSNSKATPTTLFVPFRDKTTGQQTYASGRYMEFHVDGDVASVEEVILDFNLAYHPFCAYNDSFACPLPPRENWLDVAIEAGEKLPDV